MLLAAPLQPLLRKVPKHHHLLPALGVLNPHKMHYNPLHRYPCCVLGVGSTYTHQRHQRHQPREPHHLSFHPRSLPAPAQRTHNGFTRRQVPYCYKIVVVVALVGRAQRACLSTRKLGVDLQLLVLPVLQQAVRWMRRAKLIGTRTSK